MTQETITLTREEMKKVLVIQKCMDHVMTIVEAATALRISQRQVLRLKLKLKEKGTEGIIHKNRGRKPEHALSTVLQEQIVELYQSDKYAGSNDCHFSELLFEHEQIKASPSTVRRLLLKANIKRAKQRRRPSVHRPRARKEQAGMLWQTDGTPHDWLEGRGPIMALVAAIDDATGIVVGAIFRPNEDLASYFEVMRQGIQHYGVPLAIYSDQHMIFRSPKEKLTVEQELDGVEPGLTNFGEAMKELTITHIKARTPQAKGRIERLWNTLQDRLVIELRLQEVSTIEQANQLLPSLMAKHNKRFSVKSAQSDSVYRPLSKDTKLHHILCIRDHRIVSSGETISYGGKVYTIRANNQRECIPIKTKVQIRLTMNHELFAFHKDQAFRLDEVERPQRAQYVAKEHPRMPQKPAADHPWRSSIKKKTIVKTNESAS
jgi:transposase